MEYTILPNGNLKISVDKETQKLLRRQQAGEEEACCPFDSDRYMCQVFEDLIDNTEFEWVRPEEIGALTDAPILGIWGEGHSPETPNIEKAWGYMAYEIRSPQSDLAEKGYCIFDSGNEEG